METRKTRLTTDSPTPNSGSESQPPITPTTPGRKRLIRKTNIDDNKDETKKSVEKTATNKMAKDAGKSENKMTEPPVSPTMRKRISQKILTKEELSELVLNDFDDDNDTSPSMSPITTAATPPPVKIDRRFKKNKIIEKLNENSKQITRAKRKSIPVTVVSTSKKEPMKRRNSTGRLDVERKVSARLNKDKLRSGKNRKPVIKSPIKAKVVTKKRLRLTNEKTDGKPPKKQVKIEKADTFSDSELLAAPSSRRRSDSVSKCSDMTDASSFMDVPLITLKDNVSESQESNETILKDIKTELDDMEADEEEEEIVDAEDDEEEEVEEEEEELVEEEAKENLEINELEQKIENKLEIKEELVKQIISATVLNDSGIGGEEKDVKTKLDTTVTTLSDAASDAANVVAEKEEVTPIKSTMEAINNLTPEKKDTVTPTKELVTKEKLSETKKKAETPAEPKSEKKKTEKAETLTEPKSEKKKVEKTETLTEPKSEKKKAEKSDTPTEPKSEKKKVEKSETPTEPKSEKKKVERSATPTEPKSDKKKAERSETPTESKSEKKKTEKSETPTEPKSEKKKTEKSETLTATKSDEPKKLLATKKVVNATSPNKLKRQHKVSVVPTKIVRKKRKVVKKILKVKPGKAKMLKKVVKKMVASEMTKIAPLIIETTTLKIASVEKSDKTEDKMLLDDKELDEKAESLSPALVSEGVSEISVKQFYGQPDFLENNLGIEEDPKLGEIVQEKTKLDEASAAEVKTDAIDTSKIELNGTVKEVELTSEKPLELLEIVEKPPLPEVILPEVVTAEKKVGAMETSEAIVTADIVVPEVEIIKIVTNGVHDAKIEDKDIKEEKEVLAVESIAAIEKSEEKLDEKPVEKQEEKPTVEVKEIDLAVKIEKEEKVSTQVVVEPENKENILNNFKQTDSPEEKPKPIVTSTAVVESVLPPAPADTKKDLVIVQETPEIRKQKETHLKHLGLLTHQAAVAAKIEKQKRRELLHSTTTSSSKGGKAQRVSEYTGTLKTVIKLHRPNNNEKKKARVPLKMTLHKGRGGKSAAVVTETNSANNSEEDTYYTIQNDTATDNNSSAAAIAPTTESSTYGGQNRKSHFRSYNTSVEGSAASQAAASTSSNASIQSSNESIDGAKEVVEKSLVIPEKASSFRIHPDKLCQDQCFYCGGKFGLFDTPCHVAQIKSLERQQKILDNEEKLTVDNCLCDACFRHVDRRANCPAYKKRLAQQATLDYNITTNNDDDDSSAKQSTSPTSEIEMTTSDITAYPQMKSTVCHVQDCTAFSARSVRRKWFMKMRKAISKILQLNLDMKSFTGLLICDKHFEDISHLMVCAMCKRKLSKNHIYYISQNIGKIESGLGESGLEISLGQSPVVCKLCRYYSNLLLKPPDSKSQKSVFMKNYARRLLAFHNIDDGVAASQNKKSTTKYQANDVQEMSDSDGEQRQIVDTSPATKRGRPPKSNRKSTSTNSSIQSPSFESDEKNSVQSAGGQILVDHDVMVDYDPPAMYESNSTTSLVQKQLKNKIAANLLQQQQQQQIIMQQQLLLQQQQQKLSASLNKEDISLLRSNPNISMRELFPGEEEMGLQVNVPFNTANVQRTPEGWSKCMSTIQYDEPTRHLWEELQKPYGNQSSFMRHLILLEKYFRNGDLILSHGANCNAVIYTESVQHRLQSYDNRSHPSNKTSAAQPNTFNSNNLNLSNYNLNQLYKLGNNTNSPITITPTGPKVPGKSLASSSGATVTPTTTTTAASGKQSTEPTSLLKYNNDPNAYVKQQQQQKRAQLQQQQQQFNAAAAARHQAAKREQLLASSLKITKPAEEVPKIPPGIPPELISITTTNKPQSLIQQQLNQPPQSAPPAPVPVVTPTKQSKQPDPNSLLLPTTLTGTSAQQPSKKPPTSSPNQSTAAAVAAAATATASTSKNSQSNLIRLPDILSPSERLESKTWRPTLMPVTAGPPLNGQLYQTADGRKLPSLVQVQSGGKPYLISIHDYNRMCILRRERLLRDQMMHRSMQQQQALAQHLLQKQQMQQQQQQQQQPQLPSYPSGPSSSSSSTKPTSTVTSGSILAAATAFTESLQKQKVQIPNKILEQNSVIPISSAASFASTAASSATTTTSTKSSTLDSLLKVRKNPSNSLLKQPVPIAPKPISTNSISITSTPSISTMLSYPPTNLLSISHSNMPLPPSSGPMGHHNNNNNTPPLDALLKTTQQAANSSMWSWSESLQNNGSINLDNAAASLLSKIPKSLTVIPQQKNPPSSSGGRERRLSKLLDDNNGSV